MVGKFTLSPAGRKRAGVWLLAFGISASTPTLCLAVPFLFGDQVNGAVRQVGESAGTNHFDQSSATVTNATEFSGIDGDYQITADFQSTDFVNIAVDRIPISTNATPPNYRFSFSDLDFSPTSIITGLTRFSGTPTIGIFDVVFGPDSAEFTIGTTFLSNGGSFGLSVRFETQEAPVQAPEPGSLASLVFGLAALGVARRRPRRAQIRT